MHRASNALVTPIWKTIEVGRYKGANAIREAMELKTVVNGGAARRATSIDNL